MKIYLKQSSHRWNKIYKRETITTSKMEKFGKKLILNLIKTAK